MFMVLLAIWRSWRANGLRPDGVIEADSGFRPFSVGCRINVIGANKPRNHRTLVEMSLQAMAPACRRRLQSELHHTRPHWQALCSLSTQPGSLGLDFFSFSSNDSISACFASSPVSSHPTACQNLTRGAHILRPCLGPSGSAVNADSTLTRSSPILLTDPFQRRQPDAASLL